MRPIAPLLALLVLSKPSVVEADPTPVESMGTAIAHERRLVSTSIAIQDALLSLDRGRASLAYGNDVADHAGRESARRFGLHREQRSEAERIARAHARGLVRLARGGGLRLLAEGFGGDTAVDRVQRARALRVLVRHDLEGLAMGRRAEGRAREEFGSVSLRTRAAASLPGLHAVEEHVLGSFEQRLRKAAGEAEADRRSATRRAGSPGWLAHHGALSELESERRRLQDRLGLQYVGEIRRPVEGRVVAPFGPHFDPLVALPVVRNGVELEARANARVVASADGVVTLVSSIAGFERAVVIDHGAGQFSLTARLQQVEVVAGDRVSTGDTIGRVAAKTVDDGLGDTIYFELRHGEKPIDPSDLLSRAR